MASLSFLTVPTLALLALSSSAHGAGGVEPGRSVASVCRGVDGDIDGHARRLGLDLHGFKVTGDGSIQGALEGGLRIEIRREGRRGPDTEVSLRLTAATATGTVHMEGRAFAAREHAGDPLHRVRGWLDVTEGVRGSSAPTGRLDVEGTADTHGRVISIHYTGQLCAAAVEVRS